MPEGDSAFTASRRRRPFARRNILPPKSDHLVDAVLAGRDESGFKAGVVVLSRDLIFLDFAFILLAEIAAVFTYSIFNIETASNSIYGILSNRTSEFYLIIIFINFTF